MATTIEKTILKNLIKNDEYTRKVLPFLKDSYFSTDEEKITFREISAFILKYNNLPTIDALLIEVDSLATITEQQVKSIKTTLEDIQKDEIDTNIDWLIDSTEKFCQEKAVYLGLMEAIDIMNDKNSKKAKGAIPQILTEALSVSFDTNVGHDYTEDFDSRYEYYHRKEERIPFDLDFFNKITNGGLPRKTLSVVMAGVGAGKSLFMCHHAAACLNQGKNVLYITLELAEEEVAKRIDANLMNTSFDDLMVMSKDMYRRKAEAIKHKTNGKLIIKEYPPTTASATHFRALLNELRLKKSFRPDIIFVDYINICASARLKATGSGDLYGLVKSIAEEIRGLAVEFNLPIVSATQVNRAGYNNSDFGMENTSESFGLPATCDMFFALIRTEDLDPLNQIMIKQLKNRFSDLTMNKRFIIGVDRSKMKLYDAESSAQTGITDSGQVPVPSVVVPKMGSASKKFDLDKLRSLKVE